MIRVHAIVAACRKATLTSPAQTDHLYTNAIVGSALSMQNKSVLAKIGQCLSPAL